MDKRRSIRLNIELPASFKAHDGQQHLSTATTMDISATGLCLSCKDELLIGQELPLTMRLPDNERIEINVGVMWVKEDVTIHGKEYIVGVKIIESTKPDEAKFVKFYASQFLSSYDKIVGSDQGNEAKS